MKKFLLFIMLLFLLNIACSACPLCNQTIRNAIYNSTFYPNLFTMLSVFIVLAIMVAVLTFVTIKMHKNKLLSNAGTALLSPVPLITASLVLSIGLGSFVDDIVLHQILQVHEMLSNKFSATDYIGKSVNMFWDGIFHLFVSLMFLRVYFYYGD